MVVIGTCFIRDEKNRFVQLKRGNDWGSIYLAIHPLRKGYSDANRAWKPPEDDCIPIKWPNGELEVVKITYKEETHRVGDMGHSYDVKSRIPAFVKMCHNKEVFFAFDEVKVCLIDFNKHRSKEDHK